MRGRSLNIKTLFLLLLTCGLWVVGAVAQAAPAGPVAILLSDGSDSYRQQAAAFSSELDVKTQVFELTGDMENSPSLKENVLAAKPALIYALGAKAAYAAKVWTEGHQEIPVVFAMVLNWQRYNLLEGSRNMAGVAYEIAPGTQFANMSMFSPSAKRIGLLYSEHSAPLVDQARKEAALLGLELVAEPIDRPEQFSNIFRNLSGRIDAFWVLNDPTLYTVDNLNWLEDRCVREKLFCVGQSHTLARLGLTLTVNPELSQIGVQAAAMAMNILQRGQKPADIQVMEPIGTQLLVNRMTAERIGLSLSPQSLGMATKVISQ